MAMSDVPMKCDTISVSYRPSSLAIVVAWGSLEVGADVALLGSEQCYKTFYVRHLRMFVIS
jgi:hypothetical protein